MSLAFLGGLNPTATAAIDTIDVREVGGQPLDFLTDEGKEEGGFWSILDNLKEPLSSALGTVVNAYGQKVASQTYTGPESLQDSRGNIDDQRVRSDIDNEPSFFQTNKTWLIGGGVALAAIAAYMLVKK